MSELSGQHNTPQDYVHITLNRIAWPSLASSPALHLLELSKTSSKTPPPSVSPSCRGRGENNPITLQEAQRWSNGDNIKTVLRRVTYLMDPGIEMKRGNVEKNECWREGGRDKQLWGERCSWYNIVGVAVESSRWYPCTLEQAVIETTLINVCTLSQVALSIRHTQTRYKERVGRIQKST